MVRNLVAVGAGNDLVYVGKGINNGSSIVLGDYALFNLAEIRSGLARVFRKYFDTKLLRRYESAQKNTGKIEVILGSQSQVRTLDLAQ
jgi:hypothetical protein